MISLAPGVLDFRLDARQHALIRLDDPGVPS